MGYLLYLGAVIAYISAVVACFAAWVTHVVVCLKASSWILLLIGGVIFPIGVIHGFCVWLGIL